MFVCTADAFGVEMPEVGGFSYDALLQAYARFTATQANQALQPATPNEFTQAAPRGSATPDVLPKPTTARETLLAMTPDAPGCDLAEIQFRLYDGAYRMGQELRRAFRITNTADALAAARVLYRALGIDLRTTPAGDVTIHRCFFSDYYSSAVCRVIAALDAGLFAGLSGGGQLAFTQRITEGHACCRATLQGSNP